MIKEKYKIKDKMFEKMSREERNKKLKEMLAD